jgi:hypothetical protein
MWPVAADRLRAEAVLSGMGEGTVFDEHGVHSHITASAPADDKGTIEPVMGIGRTRLPSQLGHRLRLAIGHLL